MPKKLEKIKNALVKQGHSENSAYAIATASYNKNHNKKSKKKGKKKK